MLGHSRIPHTSVLRLIPQAHGDLARLVEAERMEEVVLLNIVDGIVSNTEDHLHVVRGTISSNSSVDVSSGGSGDQIVILTRFKLQSTRSGAEVTEGDGKVLELLGFVANSDNGWSVVTHSTRVEVLLGHAVDHVLLASVLGTDQVELVILPGKVANVDIDHVVSVVQTKYRIGGVPEHEMCLDGHDGGLATYDDTEH